MKRLRKIMELDYNQKGQATTEFAIMGAVVIMLLAYLATQGFLYSSRQSLEMYAFRKALEISRKEEKGVTLMVLRDVFAPSFFAGLSRNRLQASASVEYNPKVIWEPKESDPQDISRIQLIQINDKMIREGEFFEVPPMKTKVITSDMTPEQRNDASIVWENSPMPAIDEQVDGSSVGPKIYSFKSTVNILEDKQGKKVRKKLETVDRIPMSIVFDNATKIKESYNTTKILPDGTEISFRDTEVFPDTIPKSVNLILNETVRRERDVWTPH